CLFCHLQILCPVQEGLAIDLDTLKDLMREGGRFPDLLQELGRIVAQMQELLLLEYVPDHQSVGANEAENPDHQLRLPGAVVRIDEDEPRGFPVLATDVFGPPEV